jgi:predicted O-methyltransferase YrrM
VGDDPALDAAERAAADAGLPAIGVTPPQGKLLHLLARAIGARRVLELGTLAGVSAIWLARALPPDGRLTTIELDPSFAALARANLDRAGLAGRVDVLTGPALETLPGLPGPFDLAFLDADKATMPEQLALVLPRVRAGGLVVCDNVVRGGTVVDPPPGDATARGVRAALELLAADPRIDATAVQTVGAKRHDGFALGVVRAPE